MMKLALGLLFATACFAQTQYEIHGVVAEPNVGPISGIEVRLSKQASPPNTPVMELVGTAFTDSRGEFVAKVNVEGRYLVEVIGPGYTYLSQVLNSAAVDREHPRGEVALLMVRLGQLVGRVLDADSLNPISGIELASMSRAGPRWQVALPIVRANNRDEFLELTGKQARTDENGNFTLSNRVPGDYSVVTMPNIEVTDRGIQAADPFIVGFAPDDLDIYEEVYPPLYWPGGVQQSDAQPLTLTSGGTLNVGKILLKKTPVYRAHVSVPQGQCPEGENIRLTLYNKTEARTQVVPCGSDLLLKGLFPGTYHLYAVSDWQGERDNVEAAVWDHKIFQVRDKNLTVIMDLRQGIVLDVHVTSAKGAPEVPENFALATQPDPIGNGLPAPGSEQFTEPKEKGYLRVAVGPGPQQLLSNARGMYISEARYNGLPYPDLTIPFSRNLNNQTLEVILDNKYATLSGEVPGAGGTSTVVIQPDRPGSIQGVSTTTYTARVNAGSYTSGPLPPGRYRVAVVSVDQFTPLISIAGIPLIVPADAPTVTLRPGANETLKLRLTSTPR